MRNTGIGSILFAVKPGDGSAREQAASCQRVLGGDANAALEYATKRYRSNLINWGILPFIVQPQDREKLSVGDQLVLRGIRKAVSTGAELLIAELRHGGQACELKLQLPDLSDTERKILLAGCLINFYHMDKDDPGQSFAGNEEK